MTPEMTQNDHDVLIVLAADQKEIKSDLKDVSTKLSLLVAQQSEQDNRIANLTATVTGLKLDRDSDRKDLNDLKADHVRWKLYAKVAAVMLSPVYLILLYAAEQALKAWLFP